MQRIRWVAQQRSLTLLITISLLLIITGIINGGDFFSFGNISSILVNIAFEAIVACGMTILLVSGLIDISVGSIMGFIGTLVAFSIVKLEWEILPSIFFGLAAAVIIGLLNGVIVAKIGVNPLITTIATMGGILGAAVLLTGKEGTIPVKAELYGRIGQERFFGFPIPFWIMISILIIMHYLLSKNRFFRLYYYIGENQIAAALTGINIVKMKIIGFIISAVLAGISGILFSARLSSGVSSLGEGTELRVITAVVLGGASLNGGKGTISGAFLGVIFIALINNLLVLNNVKTYWYAIINAVVLLTAVILDVLVSRENNFK